MSELEKAKQALSDNITKEPKNAYKYLTEFTAFLKAFVKTNPLKLYRYSGTDKFKLENLRDGKLRLSTMSYMNDMYDSVPASKGKIVQYFQNNPPILKCFSETPLDVLMWAHYGDKNKGMCVEYDLSRLSGTSPVWDFLFPVSYIDERPNFDSKDFITLLALGNEEAEDYLSDSDIEPTKNVLALQLFKGKMWEYEQEWRIAVPFHEHDAKMTGNRNKEPPFKENFFDFDCISAIYLGARMPEDMRLKIERVIADKQLSTNGKTTIDIYEITLTDKTYALEAKLLDMDNGRHVKCHFNPGNVRYVGYIGYIYDGEYKNGKYNGKGTFTFTSGNYVTGTWHDGKPDNPTIYNPDGKPTGTKAYFP